MRNAVGYIRVSTDGQVENGFGIEDQREQIQDYANRNDIRVLKWFIDEGESGANDSRPAFDTIIYGDTEVTNPPYEVVLVAKSDRVARDIKIYYYFKYMLTKKDVDLISVTEDFGQFGVFGTILEAFTQTMAEMERDNITKRTSGGRRQKAKLGGYAGGRPPYGYKVTNGELVIEPEEAEVVKMSFDLRDQGLTRREIADTLSKAGYRNRSGRPFSHGLINSYLSNENLYRGWYRYGSVDWVKGQHEPILEPSDEPIRD